jgi:HSP20 family protein
MTLVKRSEWPSLLSGSLLSDFFDGDRYFDADWLRKQSVPAVNVKELDNRYEIDIAAPGLSKNDFNVTVDNGILTISAEKREEKEEMGIRIRIRIIPAENSAIVRFPARLLYLKTPTRENINAHYENGILMLKVEKNQTKEVRKKAIQVK